jgi:hypothetical protein
VNVLRIGAREIEVIPHWFENDGAGFVGRDPIMIQRGV